MRRDYASNARLVAVYRPDLTTKIWLPFFTCKVSGGFPSPADDHLRNKIDLNAHLITNPPATYIFELGGLSMIGKKIYDGDLLIVDRSITPIHQNVVVATLDGEAVCKTLYKRHGKIALEPENDAFKPIEITPEMNFEIIGKVTFTIHDHR